MALILLGTLSESVLKCCLDVRSEIFYWVKVWALSRSFQDRERLYLESLLPFLGHVFGTLSCLNVTPAGDIDISFMEFSITFCSLLVC